MYQGWVLRKLTVAGTLNKNADCMTLALFTQNNDKKLTKDLCKIKVKKCFLFLLKNTFLKKK